MAKLCEMKTKLSSLRNKIERNSFIRLYRGENRKNNLRKSRRVGLIVFAAVASVIIMIYMSVSSAASDLSAYGSRRIDPATVDAAIAEVRAEIVELENVDTSEYRGKELTQYNNRMENLRRSEGVLTAAQQGNYDGKKMNAVYYIDGAWTTMGTHSYLFDVLFGSYVLDFTIMLLAIFIGIAVSGVFGAEYNEKTAKLMFIKPSSRIKLFLCKMSVVIKEMLLYDIIAFAMLIIIGWAAVGLDLKPMLIYIGNGVRIVGVFEQLVICFVSIVFASLFYAALAALFSISGKSRVLPIFSVILFSRLPAMEAVTDLMQKLAASSTAAYNLFFSNHINIYQYIVCNQPVVKGTGFTISFFVLLAYIAVLFVGAMFAFKRQKIVK